jgi:hypothetical protein
MVHEKYSLSFALEHIMRSFLYIRDLDVAATAMATRL